MKKEEFNLSEKRRPIRALLEVSPFSESFAWGYPEEDVKEFIKRCFEDMEKKVTLNKIKYGDVVRIIKKRAGEKLR